MNQEPKSMRPVPWPDAADETMRDVLARLEQLRWRLHVQRARRARKRKPPPLRT